MRNPRWVSCLVGLAAAATSPEMARGQEAPAWPAPAPAATSAPELSAAPAPAAPAPPEPAPPPPAPPPPVLPPYAPPAPAPATAAPPEDRGYGRRHSMHLGLSLGIGSGTGGMRYAGGAGFGYFLVTGVAPGVDASVAGGAGVLTTSTLTGTLRLVPIRSSGYALFLIGRAGRLFISDHADAWAAGGGAGVVIATGGNIGLQLSYEVLGLWPSGHCSDLASGCRLDAFGLGLIMGM